MKILAADYVLPISRPPIVRGGVVIDGNRIVGVDELKRLRVEFPDVDIEDFGQAAIAPGFVNCHSHLEITAMRGALDYVEHDFSAWLLRLTAMREKMAPADIEASALAGAIEGARAGVTCFGDIGRMGPAGLNALKATGLRGIVFQETEFSADNRTADGDFEKLIARFEALRSGETELVRVGLSPHSPYTVSSRLFELIAQYSILNGVPLTIHVAESADENELLSGGTGFFTEIYKKYGVEWHSPLCSPVEYLERLGVLSTRPLLAHCIDVSESDLSKIAAYNARIAHCPKSNAKFGHGCAPLEAFLDAGIPVGLGSDSVASNNVCDMLEEARFAVLAARNREDSSRFITAKEALELMTVGGAKAMGLDQLIGTLEVGKLADLAIVSLSNSAQLPINDIYAALIFASNARDIITTIVAGKRIL